jgi:hypothetical protein
MTTLHTADARKRADESLGVGQPRTWPLPPPPEEETMGFNKAKHVVANAAAEEGGIVSRGKVAGEEATTEETTKSSTPDDSWTKAEIQDFLDENEISWQSSATKADLLSLVP